MKIRIFFMMLIIVWNVIEAMKLKFYEGWGGSFKHDSLHLAIKRYPKDTTALRLLQDDVDPNEKNLDGDVPLSGARSKEQIELMLSYGADPKEMKKTSGLANVIHYYFHFKKSYKPSNVSDEQWRSEAFEAMDLLLKNGESIQKREGNGDGGLHLMEKIIDYDSLIGGNDQKPLLSFLIARGSNPNELSYRSPIRYITFYGSIYQKCQCSFPDLEMFMRKERGWYLTWPLFLMTYFNKKTDGDGTEVWDYKQPSKCVMRALPRDLVREIAKYLLNWKHDK